MVKVLDRKLLREVRGHLGMLLAVTGIIAVGVACLVTLASAYMNLSEAKRLIMPSAAWPISPSS